MKNFKETEGIQSEPIDLENVSQDLNVANNLNIVINDYLSDFETLVVRFEKERTHENAISLAWEVDRTIERLLTLNHLVRGALNNSEESLNKHILYEMNNRTD